MLDGIIGLSFNFLYGRVLLPIVRVTLTNFKLRENPPDVNAGKILVNFCDHSAMGLGDTIIFSTFFKILKYRFPQTKLCLLIGRDNKYLHTFWDKHSMVDHFLIHPPLGFRFLKSWLRFLRDLKRTKFDMAIIQSHDIVDGLKTPWFPIDPLVTFFCGIKVIIGFYDRWNENFVFTKIVGQKNMGELMVTQPSPHWTDFAADYAKVLGIPYSEIQNVVKPVFLFEKIQIPFGRSGLRKIAICPGGKMSWNRRWSLQNYCNLCTELSLKYQVIIFVLGSHEENMDKIHLIEKVQRQNPKAVIMNINNVPLNETANYIAQSDLFIGNDSGLTHLAVAVDTQVIAIFGPSNYHFWGPQKIDKKHSVISSWPKSKDINDVSVESVLNLIANKLGLPVNSR